MNDVLEVIYEGENHTIYRRKNSDTGELSALKVIRSGSPTAEAISRLDNELKILKRLKHSNIRAAISKTSHGGFPALEMEYIEGDRLRDYIEEHKPSIRDRLLLAIKTIETIDEIHKTGIIHKDINSSNILVSSEDHQPWIIDFGLATDAAMRIRDLSPPILLKGTLKYMSPEQTGRMNRIVDYRTDYYSYGVVLFEIFTGSLPFENTDPSRLLYSHIAIPPRNPKSYSKEISSQLSNTILKLLSKSADDRFSSASAVLASLKACPEYGAAPGIRDDSQVEFNDHFVIPQKLYGRKREVGDLTDLFKKACEVESQLLFITGPAGVGKSTLVYELDKEVSKRGAFFISGKYDQYQKQLPYSAIRTALNELIKYILIEPEDRFLYWKQLITESLGKNAGLMVELLPDLEKIIGPQSAGSELDGKERQNVLNLLFQSFFSSLCKKEHPLVIFIDDLQWIDPSSAALIKLLLEGLKESRLLLICAYRDREVSKSHPLHLFIEDLNRGDTAFNRIHLENLKEPDVCQLLSETFQSVDDSSDEICSLIYHKTQGNAFAVKTLLNILYQDKLVAFSYEERKWEWDIKKIMKRAYSPNVLDILCEGIQRLPRATVTILQLASCIGNHFDLKTLSLISEESIRDVLDNLWPAVRSGLIEFNDEQYGIAYYNPEVISYAHFVHDRIQQALLDLNPEETRREIHLRIGKHLLDSVEEPEGTYLFPIIDQLNMANSIIPEEDRVQVMVLNLTAGIRAKKANAYEAALKYFQNGIMHLNDQLWGTNFDLALQLHMEYAETAYLSGEFSLMNKMSQTVHNHTDDILVKLKLYKIELSSLAARGQWFDVLKQASSILQLLNVEVPDPQKADEAYIGGVLQQCEQLIGKRDPESFVDLPEITDPAQLGAMEILAGILAPAFIAAPNLFPVIVSRMIVLSLTYGNSPMSGLAYANYGILQCSAFSNPALGYRYGQTALGVINKVDGDQYRAQTINNVNVFLIHWKEPLKNTLSPLYEAFQTGLDTGDFVFAGYSINARNYHALFTGEKLVNLDEDLEHYTEELSKLNQQGTALWTTIHHQFVQNLIGTEDLAEPWMLKGRVYDEDQQLSVHTEQNDLVALFYLFLYKMILGYYGDEYSVAADFEEKADLYQAGAAGMSLIPIYHFYRTLVYCSLYKESDDVNKERCLLKIQDSLDLFKGWAALSPENYLHKYALLKAECYRIDKSDAHIRDLYDQSFSLALKNGYYNDLALANELCAAYYVSKEIHHLAGYYINNAYHQYRYWGAELRIRVLEEKYSSLLEPAKNYESSTSGSVSGTLLDLESLLSAQRQISSEIVLEKLLETLMETVLTISGADMGLFLSVQGYNFKVEVINTLVGDRIEQKLISPGDSVLIPVSIIHYVLRSKEQVLLNEVDGEDKFTLDEYFKSHFPKSVLAIPIIRQARVTGILYLENKQSHDVFSPKRVRILDLLSGQIAVSLETAYIHKNLEGLVKLRTESLEMKNRELESLTEELKEKNDQLKHLASRDPLTGMLNRRRFFDLAELLLKNAIRTQVPISVMMLDIDYFKQYNDTYGHQPGDESLLKVSSIIKDHFKRENDIIGRYGGEEFIGVLFDVDRMNTTAIVEKIRKAIADAGIPHSSSEISSRLTASIGTATINPDEKTTLNEVIHIADAALYEAKEQGRNRVVSK